MTIKEALAWSNRLLQEKRVESPKVSSEFLLRQVLNVDKSFLLAHPEKKLTLNQERKFKGWVRKRAKHEPVWYITGKIEFYGQDFFVNKSVLIPRPETEIILEKIIKENAGLKNIRVVDIGTGSGAIILTLAKELENHSHNTYFASDLSKEALRVAKKNAKNLGFEKVVNFKNGDLFGPWVGEKFDLIIANLPYIPHEEMSTLAYDLIHYEPRTALDGGLKGLEVYKRFFEELPQFTSEKAKIYCEIGHDQGSEVLKMAKKAFPKAAVEMQTDYSSEDRVVIISL